MTIQQITDKHLKECYEQHGIKIAIPHLTRITMIAKEVAEYYVTEALKAAAEKAELDYWNGSCRECGSNKIDEKSIINSYPLENIK
jgi:hypothetical protein